MTRVLCAVVALVAVAVVAGPASAVEEDRWRPCRFEDGSGMPRCVWDAVHMGNGEGQSVLIWRGGTDNAESKDINHGYAHRLAYGD